MSSWKNVSWSNAAAHVPRRNNYAIRHTHAWYLEGLRLAFRDAMFSSQEAAEIWDQSYRDSLATCRRLVMDGDLTEHRQHMFSLSPITAATITPLPIKRESLTLRDQVRQACVGRRASIVDAFKLSNIAVPRGIEWMSKRLELTGEEVGRLVKLVETMKEGK